ncbi:uncharacterized protein LOC143033965 isoform X4 [Oratosquilla oratoria]|uniref:uncharacterized protein LOC143033965 isoform X4 n=1 Tax=Oratosquilla oratoria TaxID=337810 RepID=UPI003F7702C0
MGADQQFCLRWNNFHTNITSAFESLRDDEDFVDITLACEGRQIKAHKMVLSACSPYFRSLLKGNPCQHPIVFLKDVTFANLSSILDFMYHGEVNVSHNELATFLKTAEALKVRGLAEDEKKKEAEGYNESSSPPPPRDPPDPGSPRPEESGGPTDTHLSDSSPPAKRQRRRSGTSVHSAEDTNETVLSEARDSVKNEPQDYTEEEDMLGHSVEPDIKADATEDGDDRSSSFGPSESVTISRSQAAMQQLQESFGSFLPGMGQSPGFLPHGASDMPRPPPFPLEGVQGLPPGISALPGPSMSQGASQDASQGAGVGMSAAAVAAAAAAAPAASAPGGTVGGGGGAGQERFPCRAPASCPLCGRVCSNKYILRTHLEDKHSAYPQRLTCARCNKEYSSRNSLLSHISRYHRDREPGGALPLPTVALLEQQQQQPQPQPPQPQPPHLQQHHQHHPHHPQHQHSQHYQQHQEPPPDLSQPPPPPPPPLTPSPPPPPPPPPLPSLPPPPHQIPEEFVSATRLQGPVGPLGGPHSPVSGANNVHSAARDGTAAL